MDIEQSQGDNSEQIDFGPLSLRGDKKLTLNNDAEHLATSIHSKRNKKSQLNGNIDSNNTAQKYFLSLRVKQFGNFEHFLTKNKNRDERFEVLDAVRELAQQKDISLNGRVKDKLEKCRLVLRVVSRQEGTNFVMVEDETGKQKLQVRSGIVWIGMIACMEVGWSEGTYRLDVIFDLSQKLTGQKAIVNQPNLAYRMLFMKGSFFKNDSKDNIGLKVLLDQLVSLKRERVRVNCLVVFGPLLSTKNTALKNVFSDKTYDEEAVDLIKMIRKEIDEDIQIIFLPSTDDLTSFYPIPQPKYCHSSEIEDKNVHFTSNPGFINLTCPRQNYRIDLINEDVLFYIDQNKTGKAKGDVMMQNLETYFKQPFYLTNTYDQPFDETNLPGLYNHGKFGDIVITASQRSPPFVKDIKGRLFVNIGSLGIADIETNRHFMTLLSLYDGEGSIGGRTKVQILTM